MTVENGRVSHDDTINVGKRRSTSRLAVLTYLYFSIYYLQLPTLRCRSKSFAFGLLAMVVDSMLVKWAGGMTVIELSVKQRWSCDEDAGRRSDGSSALVYQYRPAGSRVLAKRMELK